MPFLIFALAMIFTSCNQKAIDYAILSGEIENFNLDKIAINGREIPVNKDGVFTDTIYLKTSGYYSILGNNVFLAPSYNLNAIFEAKKFKGTVTFTGIGADVNTYIVSKSRKEKELVPQRDIYSKLNESDYTALFSNLKAEYAKMLEPLKKQHPGFYALESKNIDYDYLYKLSSYELLHRIFTKNETFSASDSLKNVLKDFDYDVAKDYDFSDAYRQLVNQKFLDYEFWPKVTDLDHPDTLAYVYTNIKALKSENIKNDLAQSITTYMIPSVKNLDALYHGALELATDSSINAALTKSYNIAKRLAKGRKAPSFSCKNYKGGTTALEDLKGKYVYIDMWATWCGPCTYEIPFLEKIEKQYLNKNIVFVSISIDENEESWRKFVADKQLSGIQLITEGGWKSSIMADYGISGVPNFILIDPKGNIVNTDAPKPSDKKLIKLFNETGI